LADSTGGRALEALTVATATAALGAVAGWPFGVPAVTAAVAGLNGLIGGWRQVYEPAPRGVAAIVLDSTWALPMTAASLASHGVAALQRDAGYRPELSRRANRHVYGRGFRPRRGYVITLGNVVSGAGDTTVPRRAKLVTDHEDVHVWQARWFGVTYPILYGGWMLAGAVVGALLWVRRPGRAPFARMVESCAYHLNPFEWWAYSRDAHWPPGGKVAGLGWKRPMVPPKARRP
jgi:hypothetical protein